MIKNSSVDVCGHNARGGVKIESPIPRSLGGELIGPTVRMGPRALRKVKTVSITIIGCHFNSNQGISVFPTSKANMGWEREPFHVLLPLLRDLVPLTDGNYRLTMPVANGHCARDPLRHTFDIGEFNCGKTFLEIYGIFTIWLKISLKVILMTLISMGGRVSLKRCRSLAWKQRCYVVGFVTHEITRRWGHVD